MLGLSTIAGWTENAGQKTVKWGMPNEMTTQHTKTTMPHSSKPSANPQRAVLFRKTPTRVRVMWDDKRLA